MTKQVQRRRGSSSEHTSFTGAAGEISVNTTNNTMHVHDGSTAGGFESARSDLDNVSTSDITSGISGGTVATLTITSADINGGTLDNVTIGGSTAAAGTFTNITASGTINLNGATVSDGGTVTTVDINGGTLDNVTIGGSTAGAGTFTNITATGTINLNGATVSDGGTVTTVDIDGGSIDGATIGANSAAAGTFSTATVTGDLTVDTNTLYVDSTNNRVGVGTTSPDDVATIGAETTAYGSSLTNHTLGVRGGVLGGTAGNTTNVAYFGSESTSNNTFGLSLKSYRQSTGNDWTTTGFKLTFNVDSSDALRDNVLCIDSSGNVGIGATPTTKFQIGGSTGRTFTINQDTTNKTQLINDREITLQSGSGYGTSIKALGGAGYGNITFETSNNGEVARLDSSGNLLVGTTTATGKFNVTQSSNSLGAYIYASVSSGYTSTVFAAQGNQGTTNETYKLADFVNSNGSGRCFIYDSGDIDNTNGAYGSISDQKLKSDIVDATSQWDDIKSLRFRKYKMIADPEQRVQMGLIAQELEATSPNLVKEVVDRDLEGNDLGTTTKSIKYSILYTKAVKALQEAIERIETLETQKADLEARLTTLENA